MKREEWVEYLEIEESDLLETEGLLWGKRRRSLGRRRWIVLAAACILLIALSIVAVAGVPGPGGWFASYFRVSDEKSEELLKQMELEAGSYAEDAGYRIEISEAVSDGKCVYVLLRLTASTGEMPRGEYAGMSLLPWLQEEKRGGITALTGGGYVEPIGRTEEDAMDFLFVWDFGKKVEGKRLLLEIDSVETDSGEEETRRIEGDWKLSLKIPKSERRAFRQWREVKTAQSSYFVYKVELSPLQITVSAVKRISFPQLWQAAMNYLGLQNERIEGWDKEDFRGLPVHIIYQDGREEILDVGGGSVSNHSRIWFCEKTVHYGNNRIVDLDSIREIRLGDTVLKIS